MSVIGVEAAASPAMSTADAIRYLAGEHGLIAEGAGAAPIAAILADTISVTGQTVAIISGRNITLQALAHVLPTG